LGKVALNFQEIFTILFSKGREIELRGVKGIPLKVIISNIMTQLLKKGHHGVLGQLCSLDFQTYRTSILVDLQKVINNHSKVFEEIPKGLPPNQDHDHAINL
jgi:hypothetical protein